jgi:hypothetical protein
LTKAYLYTNDCSERIMNMRNRFIKHFAASGVLAAALAGPSAVQASFTVASGWDLFTTATPATTFNYVPFQGVPLGTFDFGGSIGVQNVGNTDTIIQRPTNISGPLGGPGSTAFAADLVAFQLESANPVNFGAGLGYYFLTLQSERGGPASTDSGVMTFNSAGTGGTFSDVLDVYYDLRFGSLTGPIVASGGCVLNNAGASWTHDGSYPPIINGVNYMLDGTDTGEDFWPGYIVHYDGLGDIHVVPEPTTMMAGALLLLPFGASTLRILRKRQTA